MADKKDYMRQFEAHYEKTLQDINEIMAFNAETGKAIPVNLKPDDGWQRDPSGNAAHFTIKFPDDVHPDGKVVVGYIGSDYFSEPIEFPIDRKIHIIRGRIMSAEQTFSAEDGPIKIPAGVPFSLEGDGESVIVIDLIPML